VRAFPLCARPITAREHGTEPSGPAAVDVTGTHSAHAAAGGSGAAGAGAVTVESDAVHAGLRAGPKSQIIAVQEVQAPVKRY
jgi:hypothetical protein